MAAPIPDDSNPAAGDCFVAAFNTLFKLMGDAESTDHLLVHGNVPRLPQTDVVNHAWVETATMVYDHSNAFRTAMPKDNYYSELNIEFVRTYTPMIAMRMVAQHDHYGPWPE